MFLNMLVVFGIWLLIRVLWFFVCFCVVSILVLRVLWVVLCCFFD